MKLSTAELLTRIEQGEDLEAISLSLISTAEQGLLKCCAIVRTFDETLVDTCFRPHVAGTGKDAVPFSRLTDHDFVLRVPRTEGTYCLTPSAQKQYYDEWWKPADGETPVPLSEVPPALRDLSAVLLRYYKQLGETAKLDVLAQQVFVDKEQAVKWFAELYQVADDAFELARCRDIINVLKGRENILGASLSKVLNDTDRYLQARSRWSNEYYQTVSYYERTELGDEFETFLTTNKADKDKEWILHLHAPGGMGKTMFVRWLISRRCLPKQYSIPCARVDFDFPERTTSASQYRWLLFLYLAREFELQIPGYFSHVISKFTEYERILHQQQTDATTTTISMQLPPRERLEEDMLFLFGNALRDANLTKPALIILDTLEEIILYHPNDLLELVRQVDTLRETANVVLILSGRYDLTEESPERPSRPAGFTEEFGTRTRTVRVKPFEPTEAVGFLEKRGLTKDRPLDAVVERAEGNPFKLALFADILLGDSNITADEIRRYPSVDLLYLIQRVLARIPNKILHWLLRYGVVPRKLTLSFVKDVMKPYLERAVSGDASQDDPSRYKDLTPIVLKTVEEKGIFSKAAPAVGSLVVDEDKLWTELQNYASTYAWVTMEPADPYTAVFHGDVINPMRRWLESEPVYKLLHRDALAYFEQKAEANPREWTRWMRDAVYHKFQLEGAAAADYWHNLLVHEEDPSRRRDLAREVIGSEYVDENFKPRLLLNDKPIITSGTLATAYYELARASVGIARGRNASANDPLWTEADYDLHKCEQLQEELPEPEIAPAFVTAVRAAILTSQGRQAEAIAILGERLATNLDELSELRLETEMANALAADRHFKEAGRYWKRTLEKAERLKLSRRFILEMRRRLARLYRDELEFGESAAEYQRALDCVPAGDERTKNEILMELAGVYCDMGQLSKARRTLDEAHPADLKRLDALSYLNNLARLQLASGEPLVALETARMTQVAIEGGAHNVEEESRDLWETRSIQSLEEFGMVLSALMETDRARDTFETARGRWRELGDTKAVRRCTLKNAELFLRQTGDVRHARATIDDVVRLSINGDEEQWLEERLLSLRIWHAANRPDLRNREMQDLEWRAAKEEWNVVLRAKLMLDTGVWKLISSERNGRNRFFSELTRVLKKVEPLSLRVILLDVVAEYPLRGHVDNRIAGDLIALFPLSQSDEDFNNHGPRLVELLRVLGRKKEAIELLDQLADDQGNLFVQRRLMLARIKLTHWRKTSEFMRFVEAFLREFQNFPALCCSTIIELAELSFGTHSKVDLLPLLSRAEELLTGRLAESQWMARLYALRGRLNIRDRTEAALADISQAQTLFQSLGNNLAVARLKRFLARHEESTEVAVAVERSKRNLGGDIQTKEPDASQPDQSLQTSTIQVSENWTEALTVYTTIAGEELVTRKVPIEPDSLLDRLLAFETYENYSFSFLRSMDSNWITTCTELGKVLIDEAQAQKLRDLRRDGNEKTALRLLINALQLSSAPWELMALPSQFPGPASISPAFSFFYRAPAPGAPRATDWIYLMLGTPGGGDVIARVAAERNSPDPVFLDGPTRRALKREWHSRAGRERPRVLVLRPSIERQRATSRGHEVFGFSPDEVYQRAGFKDFFVLENPDIRQLEECLLRFEPDLVHVFCTMEESTSIGIFLDFGSRSTGVIPNRQTKSAGPQRSSSPAGDVEFLTLSAVSDLFRRNRSRESPPPLLILDVLEPIGRTELLTQLFLRNAFAAQLYQLGAFESIIAGGLTPAEAQEATCQLLVSGLASFDSVGEVVNRLRRLADLGSYTHLADVGNQSGPLRDPEDRPYLSRVVATAGIALFTTDPEA